MQVGSFTDIRGQAMPKGEKIHLTNNESVLTRPSRCHDNLWKTAAHPVINPLFLISMMAGVGFGITALVLPKTLECIDDDCDQSGLGPAPLHLGVIVIGSMLYGAAGSIGILGAKQRSNNLDVIRKKHHEVLEESRSIREEHELEFRKEEERDRLTEDEPVSDHLVINVSSDPNPALRANDFFNPLTVSFMSGAGATFCGLSMGCIIQLLAAPTQLGGSGYILSDIKAGSLEMWSGLALLLLVNVIAGALIYKNHVKTEEIISATNMYKVDAAIVEEINNERKGPRYFTW